MPRTARDVVSDLHALLQTAHVPGPYVFAAHSFGGIFARLYASTYPNEVVGMVLVDALSEKVRSGLTPEQWKLYVIILTKPPSGLEKYKDIETLDVNASFDQIEKAATAQPLRPIPLFVLTQGQPFDLSSLQPLPADFPAALDRAWHTGQDALATLAPNAKHIIATKSGHNIQVQEPQLVIDAIKQVVEAVRNRSARTPTLLESAVRAGSTRGILSGSNTERAIASKAFGAVLSGLSFGAQIRCAGHSAHYNQSLRLTLLEQRCPLHPTRRKLNMHRIRSIVVASTLALIEAAPFGVTAQEKFHVKAKQVRCLLHLSVATAL